MSATDCGIESCLPHAFGMFNQADASTSPPDTGSGNIGLALVRKLALAHGGRAEGRCWWWTTMSTRSSVRGGWGAP
ncbi:hypothetical protein [Variovorax sp. RCC_210]|uniref:hypothetical protein n=1 Tax=Variovorax sp. RCC_210 TaxID=3239217 RepID=UPI0035239F58